MPGMKVRKQVPETNMFVKILKMIPLMLLVLIAYFVVALLHGDTPLEETLSSPLFSLPLPSGGTWAFSMEHLFIMIALLLLFFELVKSTSVGGAAIAENAISTVVFIIFLVSFLLIPEAATSLFFILMMISLIDVMAGYIIGIKVARRDINFGGM